MTTEERASSFFQDQEREREDRKRMCEAAAERNDRAGNPVTALLWRQEGLGRGI
jgi:hypothetical protein